MAQKFSSTGLTGLSGNSVASPFSNALQGKINPVPLQPLNTGLKGLGGGSVASPFQGSVSGKSPVAPLGGTPSLQAPPIAPQAPQFNPSVGGSGFINSSGNYNSPTSTQYTPTVNPGDQGNSRASNPFINSLNTQQSYAGGQGNTSVNSSIGGLLGISQNQTPQVTQAQKEYADFAKQSPLLLSDVRNNPNVAAEVSVGRGNALGQVLAGEQQALSQNVSNALAGQGQQITAGTNAGQTAQGQQNAQIGAAQNVGGLTQPQSGAAFFGSPVTGNLVGSGQGGTGNQLIDGAVQNAIGMIKSGSSTSDALATLGSLGAPAQQALISAMRQYDPNWNITSSNAIAQQNMSQGQSYQQQATQLSTTLKQLDTLQPVISDFLAKSGLNQENNPFFNKAINEYKSQLQNPADVKSLNAMMADVKTYTAQILGNSGLNPTEVSSTVNSFDPSLLTGTQLTSFLNNLKNLGQVRLQPLQQTSQSSYGGAVNAFMGAQANPSTTSNSASPNAPTPGITTSDETMQGLLGLGMSAASTLGGVVGLAARFLK